MNTETLPVKDPYNPVSDMDILKSLREPKKKSRAKRVVSSSGISLRAKFALIFIWSVAGILALTLLGVNTLKRINTFFDENTFAYHNVIEVKTSWPITIEKREPAVAYVKVVDNKPVTAKALTHEQKIAVVKSSNYSKIIAGIWMLESNTGKNTNGTAHHNDCNKLSMTNEFGYRALDNFCFNSFEESVQTVDKWIDEQLKTKTVSETLCYYASGKATSTCTYAQNFERLDNSGSLALK